MSHIKYKGNENMAWVGKHIYPNTGTVVWRIQFRRQTRKGRENFSASFKTEEDAHEFCDKWEYLFYLNGKDSIDIDRIYERRKRKYYDKIKEAE
jgi:hypothetical protein